MKTGKLVRIDDLPHTQIKYGGAGTRDWTQKRYIEMLDGNNRVFAYALVYSDEKKADAVARLSQMSDHKK